jgi:hypothetical protein
MDIGWGQKAEAGMIMPVIIPLKERVAKSPSIFQRTEAFGEIRPILERLELGLGKRVIVTEIRPRMGLGDAQIGQ